MNISDYSTIVFDCDGVILDSNKVKTDAFYRTALPYGKEKAEDFVRYHKDTGGVSRYIKLQWFIDRYSLENKTSTEHLLESYEKYLESGLMSCEVAEGLFKLRKMNPNQKWMIVSGGAQSELRSLFKERNLFHLFDSGVFGSPDTKAEIISRELSSRNLVMPAIFLGDSKLDYESAIQFELDFCFLSKWTEFHGWEAFCNENNVNHLPSLLSIVNPEK